jgi:transcription elongation factor Elf1
MKLTKIISQHRRDFKGEYKCEFCNHTEIDKNMDSYDDNYFHQEVTPKMKCKSCGESTLSGFNNPNIHDKRFAPLLCMQCYRAFLI